MLNESHDVIVRGLQHLCKTLKCSFDVLTAPSIVCLTKILAINNTLSYMSIEHSLAHHRVFEITVLQVHNGSHCYCYCL